MASAVVLLIFGYVRREFVSKQIVPTEIMNIIQHFYKGAITWKFSKNSVYAPDGIFVLGPLIKLSGIPLQIAIECSKIKYSFHKHSLVLKMNKEHIEQKNIVCFVLLVAIINTNIIEKLEFNRETRFESCESYNSFSKYWTIVENDKFNIESYVDKENKGEMNITFNIDLWDIKYFKLNTINNIKWKGVNMNKNVFRKKGFDIHWTPVDDSSKVTMLAKMVHLPIDILAVCMKFGFKGNSGRTLCEREKALRRDNDTATGNIQYIELLWKGRKIINADSLIITVTRITDTSVRGSER